MCWRRLLFLHSYHPSQYSPAASATEMALRAAHCWRSFRSRCSTQCRSCSTSACPSLLTKLAGLSLVFLPLTFCWAIVRYRLDGYRPHLQARRGLHAGHALILSAAYFGVIALIAEIVHKRLPEAIREWALVIAIIVTAALFDPLKRRIQGWVDRAFDRAALRLPQGPGRIRPRPEF